MQNLPINVTVSLPSADSICELLMNLWSCRCFCCCCCSRQGKKADENKISTPSTTGIPSWWSNFTELTSQLPHNFLQVPCSRPHSRMSPSSPGSNKKESKKEEWLARSLMAWRIIATLQNINPMASQTESPMASTKPTSQHNHNTSTPQHHNTSTPQHHNNIPPQPHPNARKNSSSTPSSKCVQATNPPASGATPPTPPPPSPPSPTGPPSPSSSSAAPSTGSS